MFVFEKSAPDLHYHLLTGSDRICQCILLTQHFIPSLISRELLSLRQILAQSLQSFLSSLVTISTCLLFFLDPYSCIPIQQTCSRVPTSSTIFKIVFPLMLTAAAGVFYDHNFGF